MIIKLRHFWQETRASFWFLPAVMVLLAVLLATVLIAVDASVELHVDKRWPLVFGAGADGSRGLLTAVAGSMITVAGVVFSITIVALSLTSSQYTSRVLRNFMSDRSNQLVLGVFVGIFAYCLVVLRTIRGGDEGSFVPSLAVLAALMLAFVGIGFLIFFIHHISVSIQASSIIAEAAEETMGAVDRLFPEGLGDDAEDQDINHAEVARQVWTTAAGSKTGYIENVNSEMLLAWACKRGVTVRMERGIGEFVVEGTPLVSVAGSIDLDDETLTKLNDLYLIGRHRTVQQDASFGIRQIVDIALKALSPGINDSTTAVMCVDYLGAIMSRIGSRQIPTMYRLDQGTLRVIARVPDFQKLLAEAFDQIRQNAEGNIAVLAQQLRALETIARQTSRFRRRQALRQQVELIQSAAQRAISSSHDRTNIENSLLRIASIFDGPSP